MTSFQHKDLAEISVQTDTHAGLWLDKYLRDDKEGSKQQLVEEVIAIGTPEVYRSFFNRWKSALTECGAEFREAEVLGRMIVNLGSEAVLETSIALHHTYGVPFIPGSALKGLAAHYVLNYQDEAEWGRGAETDAFEILFGDPTSAGYVTFYDALYVPDSGQNQKALWKDIITVHHPNYYQGNEPPADWDSPVPIPFISATGKFLIALYGPKEWVTVAFELLELALEREGIGAKTSSGYGRMRFEPIKPATHTEVLSTAADLHEIPTGYQRGVVKKFMDTYGFIQPDGGGHDIFVHIKNLATGIKGLKPRQVVIFRTAPGKKPGELQAMDVRPVK